MSPHRPRGKRVHLPGAARRAIQQTAPVDQVTVAAASTVAAPPVTVTPTPVEPSKASSPPLPTASEGAAPSAEVEHSATIETATVVQPTVVSEVSATAVEGVAQSAIQAPAATTESLSPASTAPATTEAAAALARRHALTARRRRVRAKRNAAVKVAHKVSAHRSIMAAAAATPQPIAVATATVPEATSTEVAHPLSADTVAPPTPLPTEPSNPPTPTVTQAVKESPIASPPATAAATSTTVAHRAIMSRIPKRRKFFSELSDVSAAVSVVSAGKVTSTSVTDAAPPLPPVEATPPAVSALNAASSTSTPSAATADAEAPLQKDAVVATSQSAGAAEITHSAAAATAQPPRKTTRRKATLRLPQKKANCTIGVALPIEGSSTLAKMATTAAATSPATAAVEAPYAPNEAASATHTAEVPPTALEDHKAPGKVEVAATARPPRSTISRIPRKRRHIPTETTPCEGHVPTAEVLRTGGMRVDPPVAAASVPAAAAASPASITRHEELHRGATHVAAATPAAPAPAAESALGAPPSVSSVKPPSTVAAPAPARVASRRRMKRSARQVPPPAETAVTASPGSAEAALAGHVATAVAPSFSEDTTVGGGAVLGGSPAATRAAADEAAFAAGAVDAVATASSQTRRKATRAKKKTTKCLSPAAIRRRELAAFNRIPKRFRPLQVPRSLRLGSAGTVEAPDALEPCSAAITAAAAADTGAPQMDGEASKEMEVEPLPTAAAPPVERLSPVEHGPSCTAPSLSEPSEPAGMEKVTPPSPAEEGEHSPQLKNVRPPSPPLQSPAGTLGSRRVTKPPKRRFFTALEEVSAAPPSVSEDAPPPVAENKVGTAEGVAPAVNNTDEPASLHTDDKSSEPLAPQEPDVTAPSCTTESPLSLMDAGQESVEASLAGKEGAAAPVVAVPAQPPTAASPKALRRAKLQKMLRKIRKTKKFDKRPRADAKGTDTSTAAAATGMVASFVEGTATSVEAHHPDSDMAMPQQSAIEAESHYCAAEVVTTSPAMDVPASVAVVTEMEEASVETTRDAAAEYGLSVASPGEEGEHVAPLMEEEAAAVPPFTAQAVETIEAAEPPVAVAELSEVAPPSSSPSQPHIEALEAPLPPAECIAPARASTARLHAAKQKIKKHAKLAAARYHSRQPPMEAPTTLPPETTARESDAVTAPQEDSVYAATEPEVQPLVNPRKAALTLPSGKVVVEAFTDEEMMLRRATLDDQWDVGLRYDWQERTLAISSFPVFEADDKRAVHPFVQRYKSKSPWLLKEVNETSAAHMKRALDAMRRSLTARFVFKR